MFSMKKKIVEIKKIIEKKNLLDFKGEDFKKNQICFSNNEIIKIRSLSLAKLLE